nr:hypothetical protein [Tanacetum cinerariifolium]
ADICQMGMDQRGNGSKRRCQKEKQAYHIVSSHVSWFVKRTRKDVNV